MMNQALITALSLILALFLSGSQVHPGQCQSLIQQDTYVNGRDEDGNSALMPAASSPKPVRDVRILLPTGAVTSGTNVTVETALFNASRAGADNTHVKIVWAILMPESEPGAWGLKGVTALTKDEQHGNPASFQAVVASGVDVRACDRNGEAARIIDAATGYQEAAGVLPVTGAENSVPSPYG